MNQLERFANRLRLDIDFAMRAAGSWMRLYARRHCFLLGRHCSHCFAYVISNVEITITEELELALCQACK